MIMEISPWNSFDLFQTNNNNISSEINCYKSLEEEIFKIHELTQPFNAQFINEVSLNLLARSYLYFLVTVTRKKVFV